MSLPNPAADLAAFLTGKVAGGVTLTSGTNLFSGRMPSAEVSPTTSVSLLNTGGVRPQTYLSPSRQSYYSAAVQVLVRGPVGNQQTGEALARGVFELLHQATVSGYVQVLARDAGPVLLEWDAAQRGVWAVNVDADFTTALP